MSVALAAALGLLLAACAATSPPPGPSEVPVATSGAVGTWLRSRGADLLDVVPMSVGLGLGTGVAVRATCLFHVGIGPVPVTSWRWGYDDRSLWGEWREHQLLLPWTLFADDLLAPAALPEQEGLVANGVPLVWRWQARPVDDEGEQQHHDQGEPHLVAHGRHPPVARTVQGAFLIPEVRRAVTWEDARLASGVGDPLEPGSTPRMDAVWLARADGERLDRDVDLFEVDLFAVIVGVRVGLRPLQVLDLVAGLVGFDPFGDDLPRPSSFVAAGATDG